MIDYLEGFIMLAYRDCIIYININEQLAKADNAQQADKHFVEI